jgi:hypothetical protein
VENKKNNDKIEEYDENFEEEKMDNVQEEEKTNEEKKQTTAKPYSLEESIDEYEDDYQ